MADAFDRLVTDGSRDGAALMRDRALEELRAAGGSRFCAAVVAALERLHNGRAARV